jgi:hypothetical protein
VEKLDLRKDLKHLYRPSAKTITEVQVPLFTYLMIDGRAQLRIEDFAEGCCAQTVHVGPFSTEGATIKRVHDYIDARSGRRGKHHEIYLTDIRRTDPSRWKTVIRQPMG